MIHLELSKSQALLAFDLFKANTEALLDQIMSKVEDQVNQEDLMTAARKNYVTNLENEVKNLRAQIDAKNIASDSNQVKVRTRAKKVEAPWGYKKDGTPKKKPGGRVGF